MSKERDFSDYEVRRAIHHEVLCRNVAAALICEVGCWRRKCRRDLRCTGPMVISPRQAGTVAAQKAIGLSGNACAALPQCVATCEDWEFELFKQLRTAAAVYPSGKRSRLPSNDAA